jgi:hypothetical protein
MTKQERETLERLTDFDYAWYKENVLDKKAEEEVTEEKVDEPAGDYENIPSHHLPAIVRGINQANAGELMSKGDEEKLIRKRYGF